MIATLAAARIHNISQEGTGDGVRGGGRLRDKGG